MGCLWCVWHFFDDDVYVIRKSGLNSQRHLNIVLLELIYNETSKSKLSNLLLTLL